MSKDPRRVSNYKPFLDCLNMKNIKSPASIDSIGRFEKQNEDIAITVFGIEKVLLNSQTKSCKEKYLRDIYPMYRSKFKDRKYVIDLLFPTFFFFYGGSLMDVASQTA